MITGLRCGFLEYVSQFTLYLSTSAYIGFTKSEQELDDGSQLEILRKLRGF